MAEYSGHSRRTDWYSSSGSEPSRHPTQNAYDPTAPEPIPPAGEAADHFTRSGGISTEHEHPYDPRYGGYGYGYGEMDHVHQMRAAEAQSAATAALILGIVGLFTLPIILGPLALWQASKARRLGHEGGAGWVLGWICTLWGAALFMLPVVFIVLFMAAF